MVKVVAVNTALVITAATRDKATVAVAALVVAGAIHKRNLQAEIAPLFLSSILVPLGFRVQSFLLQLSLAFPAV